MAGVIEKLRLNTLFSRGVRHAERGEFDKALAVFQELAKRDPDMPLAHANAGFCLYRLGKTPDAIAAYEKARKLAPEDSQHAHDMGCVLYTSGQKDKAFDLFLVAAKADPSHKEAHAALEKVRADLNIPANDPRLVGVLPSAPVPAPAPAPEKPTAQQAPPAAPKKQSAPPAAPAPPAKKQPEVVNALVDKGHDLYVQGEFNAALAAWNEAVRLDPVNAKAHNNRAAALYELGRHQEAIEACSEALRVQPGYAVAHMTRGEIYAAMGNRDAVMREYTALNAIDEDLAQQLIDLIRGLKDRQE